jgi:membrane associated rhomboid family serine protease
LIPLRDINPTRRFPIITVALIAANALVFIYQFLQPSPGAMSALIHSSGLVPYNLTQGSDPYALSTLVTSLFLHGGVIHIAGNMLYLWIFGNNIEDFMGSVPFIFFYLACGVASGMSQVAINSDSTVPIVGASGAIAGVLGAYLLLFPTARVEGLIFLGFFIRRISIPAVVYLGAWIALQILSSLTSLDVADAGGIAWFAHIGGFLAGILLILPFRIARRSAL